MPRFRTGLTLSSAPSHPGTLTYRDIVELLGQHAQHSERLAFLRLYFDFHELYKVGPPYIAGSDAPATYMAGG